MKDYPIHNYKQPMLYLAGVCFLFIGALLPLSAQAGNLDSSFATTAAGSAMFTITDIYNRLNTGAVATKRAGGFTEPAAGPIAGTGKTLDDVMTLVNSRAHAVCAGTLNGTRWCDNGDGTATDLTTGLIWLQDAAWGGLAVFWANADTATNAHDRAAQVKNGTPATLSDGSVQGDWRLPTFKELKHLNTSGTEDVSSNTMRAFTGVQTTYWSSATNSASTRTAWIVNLSPSGVRPGGKFGSDNVWPVRGQ